MRLQHTKQRVKEDNIEVDQQKVELESGLPDWSRFSTQSGNPDSKSKTEVKLKVEK